MVILYLSNTTINAFCKMNDVSYLQNMIGLFCVSGFLPPGFSPIGHSKRSRRGSVCGSNVPLITELGKMGAGTYLPTYRLWHSFEFSSQCKMYCSIKSLFKHQTYAFKLKSLKNFCSSVIKPTWFWVRLWCSHLNNLSKVHVIFIVNLIY